MKTKTILSIATLTILAIVSAQAQQPRSGKTDTGIEYTVLVSTQGLIPQTGDMVAIHYIGTLADGTEFDNSYKANRPLEFPLGKRVVIPGWDEIVAMMRKGERWKIAIPSDQAYGDQARGQIPSGATLYFEMELVGITPPPRPLDITGIESTTTESGVKYYIVQKGSGSKPKKGDQITFQYAGFMPDGKVLESSAQRGGPIDIILGRSPLMPGWEDMLTDMQTGEKRQIVIPPTMTDGMIGFPADADMVFDFELVSFFTPRKPEPFAISDLQVHTAENGMKYYIISDQGQPIQQGQAISMDVTIYRPDGNILRSTIEEGRPIKGMVLGVTDDPIFESVLKLMTTQGKCRFYLTKDMIPEGEEEGFYMDVEVLEE